MQEACILRHTHGPLQAEEERAPFKARIAEFDSCGERIDRLVDALRVCIPSCQYVAWC